MSPIALMLFATASCALENFAERVSDMELAAPSVFSVISSHNVCRASCVSSLFELMSFSCSTGIPIFSDNSCHAGIPALISCIMSCWPILPAICIWVRARLTAPTCSDVSPYADPRSTIFCILDVAVSTLSPMLTQALASGSSWVVS